MRPLNLDEPTNGAPPRFALFALGFRPFFLVAAFAALILMAVWSVVYGNGYSFASYYGSVGWHSHEMIFGYAVAVIAGFLLTAVRNWTGVQTAHGKLLAALVGLWLAGRLVPFLHGSVPLWAIALVDGAFLPVLAATLAAPLLQVRRGHNIIFLLLLGVMALGNVLVHLDITGVVPGVAHRGTYLGLNVVLLLIVIMGGRVIPFFTERAIPRVSLKRWTLVEWVSQASLVLVVLLDAVYPFTLAGLGILYAVAAAANGLRLAGWYTGRVWSIPLLWVLHAGYAWVVVGFGLKAAASASVVSPLVAVHAFTAGGIGVLTLGMMARVALGHTGRPLEPPLPVVLAFVFVNLAAVVRVLLPWVFPKWYLGFIAVSGGLWAAAFLLFTVAYIPILVSPRVDGRPG